MKQIFPVLLLFCLFFTACQQSYFFEEDFDADDGAWAQKDIARFNVSIPDTNRIYNLHLDINHSSTYAYENCYLMIETTTPPGEQLQKRINIDMADKAGKWYGKCSGKACKLRINLQPNAFFDVAGEYQFAFGQYMREDPLPGINRLTFIVEDTGLRR